MMYANNFSAWSYVLEQQQQEEEDELRQEGEAQRRKRVEQDTKRSHIIDPGGSGAKEIKRKKDPPNYRRGSILEILVSGSLFLLRGAVRSVRVLFVLVMGRINTLKRPLGVCLLLSIAVYMMFALFQLSDRWGNQGVAFKDRPRRGPFNGYKNCNPEQKVAFLKTHKCASSTIQNMLLRYAANRNLNVALPIAGNYVGRYKPFHRSALWGTPWDSARLEYNFFCLHTIWDYHEVEYVMGPEKPVYFSILRDPVELFISLWDYARFQDHFHVTLEEYALSNKTGPLFGDRTKLSNLGRNQMLWDFGLEKEQFDNEQAILAKINEIDDTFDMILIADMFDESMVLLKDLLCWTYEEMTYLKLNSLKKEKKSFVSPEAREALKKWLWGDYLLYDHFKKKFKATLKEFGEDKLDQEKRILRTANDNVRSRCIEGKVDNKDLKGKFHSWSNDVEGYQVKDEADSFCTLYGMSEIAFLDHIRDLQTERANEVLDREDFELDENPHLIPGLDPKMFDPMSVTSKNGMPDIEKLKQIFRHSKR